MEHGKIGNRTVFTGEIPGILLSDCIEVNGPAGEHCSFRDAGGAAGMHQQDNAF